MGWPPQGHTAPPPPVLPTVPVSDSGTDLKTHDCTSSRHSRDEAGLGFVCPLVQGLDMDRVASSESALFFHSDH